ncbi:hypothetical protein BDY21DRAFT_333689 [Lineolata rhizophorae]|uniref:Uncharacterized protein n=1 Tax=Lineolata rhizophorae TaxID=578093 RepID=A0A6A6PAH0_9PEZI|nr:hypothetical protein BDY21DRAFT_333689 [Lineolata rhizophorae]
MGRSFSSPSTSAHTLVGCLMVMYTYFLYSHVPTIHERVAKGKEKTRLSNNVFWCPPNETSFASRRDATAAIATTKRFDGARARVGHTSFQTRVSRRVFRVQYSHAFVISVMRFTATGAAAAAAVAEAGREETTTRDPIAQETVAPDAQIAAR